jgi:hypothetical protein
VNGLTLVLLLLLVGRQVDRCCCQAVLQIHCKARLLGLLLLRCALEAAAGMSLLLNTTLLQQSRLPRQMG